MSLHETPTRLSGFAFTHLKKFLRVPRGVFSKTLLGRAWDSVPQRESESARRGAPFQAGQSPFTKHRQTVRLCLYAPKKVFEGSKGRFFKNAPWQGVGQRPTKGEGEPAIGGCLFREGVKRNDGYGVQIFAFFRSFPERFGRGCRYGRRPRFPYQ